MASWQRAVAELCRVDDSVHTPISPVWHTYIFDKKWFTGLVIPCPYLPHALHTHFQQRARNLAIRGPEKGDFGLFLLVFPPKFFETCADAKRVNVRLHQTQCTFFYLRAGAGLWGEFRAKNRRGDSGPARMVLNCDDSLVEHSWNEYAPVGGNDRQSSGFYLPSIFRGLQAMGGGEGIDIEAGNREQGTGKERSLGFFRALTLTCDFDCTDCPNACGGCPTHS